jgi:hypothetical protein
MTLGFRVLIGEIRKENVGREDEKTESKQEQAQRQNRLLRALLSDEAVLSEFMTT